MTSPNQENAVPLPASRLLCHTYEDGVVVEIDNGSRIFYDQSRNILCEFPGYTIEKYLITSDLSKGIEEAVRNKTGTLCLTNDGPLLLIFKVSGSIRIHMMRSANHGFEAQFIDDFRSQYNNASFEDLFSDSVQTSTVCHLFRQGARTSAMTAPNDSEWRTMLYMGDVKCLNHVEERPVPLLVLHVSTLTSEECVDILENSEIGLACYRYEEGEIQLLSHAYLHRVAVMTGVSIEELIPTSSLPDDTATRLASSRFPRMLDLFSLYVLCGTNSTRRMVTVSGFNVRLDRSGRVLATPKRGFYNFCRTAGANPRSELSFPATPSMMRLAVRRIILKFTLQSRITEVEKQFDDYEYVLGSLTPMLIARVLSGPPAMLFAFEKAFGVKASDTVSSLPTNDNNTPPSLRSVRSALLLCDHYRLATIARFALRHLLNSEFTPSAMAADQLIAMLTDYSNSSRRRRTVAATIVDDNPEDIFWPPLNSMDIEQE